MLWFWLNSIRSSLQREEGQTMSEYSVVLGVIVLGIIAAIGFLALAEAGKLNAVTTVLGGAIS